MPAIDPRPIISRWACAAALTLIAPAAVAAPAASAAPGDLDPTFAGGAGSERFFPSEEEIALRGVATQPDGKIVLTGSEDPGSLIVVRLLANGAFDPSFGSGGKVTTPFPGAGNFGEGRAVAIQPDGRIVVAGAARGAVKSDFLIARYNADGSPDASFGGGDGIEIVPVGPEEDRAEAVVIGAGGRIFLTGEARLPESKDAAGVAVLQPSGKPDPGFSTDGVTLVETTGIEKSDQGEAIAEQPDGKIVVADSTGNGAGHGFTLVRLLANGELDKSFDGDGIVKTLMPNSTNEGARGRVTDLVLQPDGRIAAAGYGYDEVGPTLKLDSQFGAVRYLPNGELDKGFGGAGTGIFVRQAGAGEDSARAIELTPAGKLLLAGSYDATANNHSPAVMRLDANGLLDPTFGSGGLALRGVTAPFGESFDDAALDSDERLVVVSTAFEGGGRTNVVVTRFLGDKQPALPVAGVDRPPHARMKKVPKKISVAKLKGFSGTASDPDGGALRKVQVAVVKRGCSVLNGKGHLKQLKLKKGKRCPQRWLDAKGKAKWRFKLKAELPPGRYVVFSRAVAANGLAESVFSRKAGNRYAFRVIEG